MKLVFFFAFLVASVTVFAQQAPHGVDEDAPHGVNKQVPYGMGPTYPMVVGLPKQPGNVELSKLLQAQTTAIKSLSSKLDSLEERIGKIEKGRR